MSNKRSKYEIVGEKVKRMLMSFDGLKDRSNRALGKRYYDLATAMLTAEHEQPLVSNDNL